MSRSIWILALLATPSSVLAASPDTIWLEDVHIQPGGPPELQLAYDFYDSRRVNGPQINLLSVKSKVGFDRAPLDFVPSIGIVQSGDGPAIMDHVELRLRFRIAGSPGEPKAIVYGGYRRVLRGGWDHMLEQGIANRWTTGGTAFAVDLSIREGFGEAGTFVELRPGIALTYGVALDLIRFGVEAYALIPLTGQRFSDYALGGDIESASVNIGPSLRFNFEYFILGLSAVTARITENGPSVSVRAIAAAQF